MDVPWEQCTCTCSTAAFGGQAAWEVSRRCPHPLLGRSRSTGRVPPVRELCCLLLFIITLDLDSKTSMGAETGGGTLSSMPVWPDYVMEVVFLFFVGSFIRTPSTRSQAPVVG